MPISNPLQTMSSGEHDHHLHSCDYFRAHKQLIKSNHASAVSPDTEASQYIRFAMLAGYKLGEAEHTSEDGCFQLFVLCQHRAQPS